MTGPRPRPWSGQERLFLCILAAYFGCQLILRLVVGGALETDEAEMVLLTPGFLMGYGPQLPLYSWFQAASFAVFGRTVFAIAIVKNLSLFVTFAFLLLALRETHGPKAAILGTLSLALLPDVFWEGQRATAHSVALMLAITATLAAVARVLTRERTRDYLILGIAIGIGGLSKYNYWLVPGGMALAALFDTRFRGAVLDRRILLSLLVAAVILALPYAWMLRHPDLAFASGYKLGLTMPIFPALPWLNGLAEALKGLVSGMALLLIVCAWLWWRVGRNAGAGSHPPFTTLLARAALAALLPFLAGIILSGATHAPGRWLLPVFLMAAPVLILRASGGDAAAGLRRLTVVAACLAALTLVGMAGARTMGTARGAVDFDPLEVSLAAHAPGTVPILADFYLGGNLTFRNPDWNIRAILPIGPPPEGPFLLLTRGEADIGQELARAGFAEPVRVKITEETRIELPFRYEPDRTLDVRLYSLSPR